MKKWSRDELRRRIDKQMEKSYRDKFERKPTDHDWMFVYSGTEMDISAYVSVLVLNPGFIYFGIIMATGRAYNPVLMYIVVDGITIIGWTIAALYQKRKQDKWNAMTPEERKAYFQHLLDSLDDDEETIRR